MKRKSLLVLVCCIFIGTAPVSANSLNGDNGNVAELKGNSPLPDYCQRQMNIHSRISGMFSGTYLDSMNIAINVLCDSVRSELSKTKTKDSAAYYKTCLDNILQDSLMLDRLSKLSTYGEHIDPNFNGILTAHCIDVSNSIALDSVGMDLFSGNRLIASAVSDRYGIIQIQNIPKGDYDIVFSRRSYVPVSLKHIKFTDEKQPNIYIPLKKQSIYLARLLNDNIWVFLATAIILFLIGIIGLVYYRAKYITSRRREISK